MTLTTTTTTQTDEASLPKNPMRSTWYNKPEEELDFAQRLIRRLGVLPDEDKINQAPVAKKGDKVPYYPVWNQHLFIFPRAIVPLVLHRLYMELLPGWTMHPIIAVPFYFFAAKAFALSSLGKFNELSYKYGFFDGEKPRDKVPDVHSKKVLWSLLGVLSIRPLLAVFAFYNREEKPSLSIWFPLQLCLYSVTLDFFFYIYHRAMHEVPGLWQFHSRHHRTKHPNALLGAFADVPQEWGDIAVIPVLTWLVLRYDFSTWYMCNVYSLYTEAFGHTGIRLYWQTPASGPFLRPFGAELILEDHDLHHQKGHRKSHAYGKQSALWDHIFGTKPKRVECTEDLIDWNHRVN